MSVVSEITRINQNIAAAYTACSGKGAALPQTQNSANLASTIGNIPAGGSEIASAEVNQNGTITFYDKDGNPLFTTSDEKIVTSGNQQISMGYDNGGFYFLFDDGQEVVNNGSN